MPKEQPKVLIKTKDYEGEDRRENSVVGALCRHHYEHTQVINMHDRKLIDLENDHKNDVTRIDQKISDRTKEIFDEVRTKAPNKLLYTFIVGYTAFFVVGIATVYNGMHQFDKNISKELSIVKEEVSKSNVHLLYQKDLTEKLEKNMDNINKKIDDHINQTKNGGHHK